MKSVIIKACKSVGVLMFFIACGHSSDTKQISGRDAQKENEIMDSAKNKLIYENDSVREVLFFKHIETNKIEFSYSINKKRFTCESTLSGVAVNNKADFDPELDEDEDGVAYPSSEYEYKKDNCSLYIRIAMKDEDKAIVKVKKCNNLCYREVSGILKRGSK